MPDPAYFMGFARHAASQSKDRETKVGAVIVGPGGEVRLTGYNGPPRGVADLPERLCRPTKYSWMSHAEQNTIAFAAREGIRTKDCSLFVTHPPCSNCARSIIQAGIVCVFVGEEVTTQSEEDKAVVQAMFEESGVLVAILKQASQKS